MGYDCYSCGLPEAICICIDVDDDEDEDWSCAFPDRCLMAHTDHMRDECHTAEMYEEYMSAEAE